MMQTIIKCPNCGTIEHIPFYEPDNDHNRICSVCKTTFKWEES